MKKLSLIGTMAMALAFGLAACDDSSSNAEGTNGENSVPGGNGGSASGADPETVASELYARADLTTMEPNCGMDVARWTVEHCMEFKTPSCDNLDESQDVWEYSWRYKSFYRSDMDTTMVYALTNAGAVKIEFKDNTVIEKTVTYEQLSEGTECREDSDLTEFEGGKWDVKYTCENGVRKGVEISTYTGVTKEQYIAQAKEMGDLGVDRCGTDIDK